jgi:LmbE family N-acetylglucosaminyl deacetylase
MLEARARRLLLGAQHAIGRELSDDDLRTPAIVFAPHPDDETLGCGGAIARRRRLGAPVTVAFMTDGSASHRRFMPAAELKAMRAREAVAACRILGVDEPSIAFLEFEDGRLDRSLDEAKRKVRDLFGRVPCEDVYIPYRWDPHRDHKATRKVVLAALRESRKAATVYEYPIWLWRLWPWTATEMPPEWNAVTRAGMALRSLIHLAADLHWTVDVSAVLDVKRRALEQHQSQVMRVRNGAPWPSLYDVSNGEFVACFFRDHESFARRRVP